MVRLFNLKDLGSRLTRWRLKLEEYQHTIQYKPGASNTNAEALSRIHRVVTRSKQNTDSTDSIQETGKQVIPSEDPQQFSETRPEYPEYSEDSHSQETDEYERFLTADSKQKTTPNVLEISGNIFDEELNSSLTVCVSADFKMAQGIELAIRRQFGNIARLVV